MDLFLLNIAHDAAAIMVGWLAALEALREDYPFLSIFLSLLIHALEFVAFCTNNAGNLSYLIYNFVVPEGIALTIKYFLTTQPIAVYHFSKLALLLLFIPSIGVVWYLLLPYETSIWASSYLVVKVALLAVSFTDLTAGQAILFWPPAALFILFETYIVTEFIHIWGYGPDFIEGQFYAHWPKYFRYDFPTPNRVIMTGFFVYSYGVAASLLLFDAYHFELVNLSSKLAWFELDAGTREILEECYKRVGVVKFLLTLIAGVVPAAAVLTRGLLSLAKARPVHRYLSRAARTSFKNSTVAVGALVSGLKGSAPQYRFTTGGVVAHRHPPIRGSAVPLRPEPPTDGRRPVYTLISLLVAGVAVFGAFLYVSGPTLRTPSKLPPTRPSTAGLGGDTYDFLVSLLEPDTVSSLRYGILFLLALSSLGLHHTAVTYSSNSITAAINGMTQKNSLSIKKARQLPRLISTAYSSIFLTLLACVRMLNSLCNTAYTTVVTSIACEKQRLVARLTTTRRQPVGQPHVGAPDYFTLFATPAIQVVEEAARKAAETLTKNTSKELPSKPNTADLGGDTYDFLVSLLESDSVSNLRYGILFLLALSSLGVYSIILAGWSSNSKYAFIGALRSAAQMISYEVAISLIILPVVILSGSLDLSMITYVQHITVWFCLPLLPIALLFLIAMLAETNRTPFDLPEAEAELVAGYNVDYSSLPFAMFFLGEYCNMILISTLFCLLFLSGGLNSFGVSSAFALSAKAAFAWIFFVIVRATLPRYRYDQLMDIGWKVFLPVAGSFLLLVFGLLVACDALPVANELPRQFWEHQ